MKRDSIILALGVFVGMIPALALVTWETSLNRRQGALDRRIAAIQDSTRAYTATVQNTVTNANELEAVIAEIRTESERLKNQLIQTNRITEDMLPLISRFIAACQELKTQSLTDVVEVNAHIGITNALFDRDDAAIVHPFGADAAIPESLEAASSMTLDELLAGALRLDETARNFIVEFDRISQARLAALTGALR